jgi:NDP-sugar pyrophosphorylase family protein
VGHFSFLDLVVRQLRYQGIRRLVMCTGYLGEQIERAFGNGSHLGLDITYSSETSPMGTAGAVLLARDHLGSASTFLVMNGDSFIQVDFSRLLDFHRGHGGIASVVVRFVADPSRYGTVHADSNSKIDRFLEKAGSAAPGLVNAGVYVFHTAVFSLIQKCPSSLEHDIFPTLLDRGVFAYPENGLFVDIGTPEDYARAQDIFQQLYDAAADEKSAACGHEVSSGVTS